MKTIIKTALITILFHIFGHNELFAYYFTAYTEEGAKLEFRVIDTNSKQCAVHDCQSINSVITIPSEVEDEFGYTYTVIRIDYDAFYCRSDLNTINIPNTIINIGSYAFYKCSGLSSINIPNSIIEIDDYAFAGCTNLNVLDIPDNVEFIGSNAFSGCKNLNEISIGTNLAQLSNKAFIGCDSIMKVSINSNMVVSKNKKYYIREYGDIGDSFSNIFGPQVKQYILGDSIKNIIGVR